MVIPLAIVQGITGVGLILASGRNLAESRTTGSGARSSSTPLRSDFAIFVSRPARRGARPHDLDAASAACAGSAPSGPPPEFLAAVKASSRWPCS